MTKFSELKLINVSKDVEKKGRFNYLSWAAAVEYLMDKDADAWWEFPNPTFLQDGTVLVYCQLHAFNKTINMHLPVLNHNNKPITEPNSFDINTAMMRCLAKAIACTGIGLYIYKGEDLPESPDNKENPPPIHMDMGADDIDPETWLNSTIEGMYSYVEKPKSTVNKFVEVCGKKRLDPIFAKLTEEQKDTFEIAVQDAGKKLEEIEIKRKEKKND